MSEDGLICDVVLFSSSTDVFDRTDEEAEYVDPESYLKKKKKSEVPDEASKDPTYVLGSYNDSDEATYELASAEQSTGVTKAKKGAKSRFNDPDYELAAGSKDPNASNHDVFLLEPTYELASGRRGSEATYEFATRRESEKWGSSTDDDVPAQTLRRPQKKGGVKHAGEEDDATYELATRSTSEATYELGSAPADDDEPPKTLRRPQKTAVGFANNAAVYELASGVGVVEEEPTYDMAVKEAPIQTLRRQAIRVKTAPRKQFGEGDYALASSDADEGEGTYAMASQEWDSSAPAADGGEDEHDYALADMRRGSTRQASVQAKEFSFDQTYDMGDAGDDGGASQGYLRWVKIKFTVLYLYLDSQGGGQTVDGLVCRARAGPRRHRA